MVIYDNIPLNSLNEKCLQRKLQGKSKHILSSISVSENRAVYDIYGENIKRIFVFPLRQWLRERVTVLRNAYNAYLVLPTYLRLVGSC
jgi:hypothetical protein